MNRGVFWVKWQSTYFPYLVLAFIPTLFHESLYIIVFLYSWSPQLLIHLSFEKGKGCKISAFYCMHIMKHEVFITMLIYFDDIWEKPKTTL